MPLEEEVTIGHSGAILPAAVVDFREHSQQQLCPRFRMLLDAAGISRASVLSLLRTKAFR